MYVPSVFAENDLAKLFDFMESNSFALLTTHQDGRSVASHLPFLVDRSAGPNGSLLGHLARANPQWRHFPTEALVVFAGPHAYISPSWYEAKDVVPTWNYVAIHAYGTVEIVEDHAELARILKATIAIYEQSRATPWTMDFTTAYAAKMMKGIVGFRIALFRLEGKWKLNQNHPPDRRERVMMALHQEPGENAQAIASLMKQSLENMNHERTKDENTKMTTDSAEPQT
jgi:transcriptional regulator